MCEEIKRSTWLSKIKKDNNIVHNKVGYLIHPNQSTHPISTVLYKVVTDIEALMIKSKNNLSIFKFLHRTIQPDIQAKSAHCLTLHNFPTYNSQPTFNFE